MCSSYSVNPATLVDGKELDAVSEIIDPYSCHGNVLQ